MDNFLQLVPMEVDADSDSALVYGEEEELVGHDAHDTLDGPLGDDASAQFFEALPFSSASVPPAIAIATVNAPDDRSLGASPTPFEESSADGRFPSGMASADERAHFVRHLTEMAVATERGQTELAERLNIVRDILLITNPVEQMKAYSRYLQDWQRRCNDGAELPNGVSATDLLKYAQQMTDPQDNEFALLAAFTFLSDHDERRPGSTAPAVAAMLYEIESEQEYCLPTHGATQTPQDIGSIQ